MQSNSTKLFKKGFKYPIYPSAEQAELLARTFGCCRYVWNKALTESIQEYKAKKDTKLAKPGVSGYDFVNKLTKYKQDTETSWLNEVSSTALQQTMLHLGQAYTRFFKERKGYPKFKKKYSKQSFSLTKDSFRIKDKQLYIAKSKVQVALHWTRELPNQPSSATISRTTTGKYYISFICEYTPVKSYGKGEIGIDLGLKDFLTTSDGTKIANPKHLKHREKQLRRAQQSLSRKQKGSSNRNKARKVVAKCHFKIANSRSDFLHKLSRSLVNKNQVIGLEKLIVKNMIKNRKLSKHIGDASWSSFTTMLNYKAAESQNCDIIYMDSFFPSTHICHIDKHRLDRKLKLSERSWTCPKCLEMHDRDINAAINIKYEALLALRVHNISEHTGRIILTNSRH